MGPGIHGFRNACFAQRWHVDNAVPSEVERPDIWKVSLRILRRHHHTTTPLHHYTNFVVNVRTKNAAYCDLCILVERGRREGLQ